MTTNTKPTVRGDVLVYVRGRNGKPTTVNIPPELYADMIRFGDAPKIADACRAAAIKLAKSDVSNFAKAVREQALFMLRGGFMPEREMKTRLYQLWLEAESLRARETAGV